MKDWVWEYEHVLSGTGKLVNNESIFSPDFIKNLRFTIEGKFAADANNDGYVSAADEAYAGMRGFRTRPDGRDEDEEGATTPLTSYPSSGEPKSQFDSPDQAARAVMLARASGRGLEAGKIMQDPNYELGSGSSLRQAPRQLGTQSGRIGCRF